MSGNVWLRLGRVSNLPTVWSNTLAASLLAGVEVRLEVLFGLIVALSLFYTGGMYLNDAFDAERDAVERATRPIPAGDVQRRTVYGLGFAQLALGQALLMGLAGVGMRQGLTPAALGGLALAGLIIAYNVLHAHPRRSIRALAPWLMGACRGAVYAAASLVWLGEITPAVARGALVVGAYVLALTWIARDEVGSSDGPDRWKHAPAVTVLGAVASFGLWAAVQRPASLPFAGLLCMWIPLALHKVFTRSSQRSVPGGVVRLIAGICLVDATLLSAAGHWLAAIGSVALAVWTRRAQRHIPGT